MWCTAGSRLRAWAISIGKLLLARLPLLVEALRIALVRDAALDDGDALPRVGDAVHIDAERKAVEQLRPQVAFLRIHRADQHEARRVAEADALALDHVDAHGRRIEQQVDDMVVEQVDLVDVKQPAVGGGQHARLEAALALLNGLLDVQRADDAVLGRADRQVDEPGAPLGRRQHLAARHPVAAQVAQAVDAARLAAERAIGNDLDLGQQGGQRARRSRLRRAALAANQHAADLGGDRVQDERPLHLVLARRWQ